MKRKDAPLIEVKAEGDAGEFTALVAAFNNVDLVGDRILPGAFTKTLAEYRAKGDPIPVIWSHDSDNPMMHVGAADPENVTETEAGLQVRGKLDIEDNPMAAQTFKLLKTRRLKAFSFGYTVPAGGQKTRKGANEISEIDLVEVGPTLKGANPEAQLQATKALNELSQHESENEDREAQEPAKPVKASRQGSELANKVRRERIRAAAGL